MIIFLRMFFLILILTYQIFPFDFSKYTVIDSATKKNLQAKRKHANPDSAYIPGVLSVFGNSITVEDDFWSNIPGSELGIVPGTIDSTYSGKYKCAENGNRLLHSPKCFKSAVEDVKPEVVIIMYGTNEIYRENTNLNLGLWKNEYSTHLDALLAIGTVPIISTIPPYFDRYIPGSIPVDSLTGPINDTIKSLAKSKHIVLVDYHKAVMDYTKGDPFTDKWYSDEFIHPSGGCEPDTSEPTCGYAIRNAVCWQAVNKVYRIVVDDGPPDTGYIQAKNNTRKKFAAIKSVTFKTRKIAGRSIIEITFANQTRPELIRMFDASGKKINTSITGNSKKVFLEFIQKNSGIAFIEILTQKYKYRKNILLVN